MTRSIPLNGDAFDDNGDGYTNTVCTIGSNPNQTDYIPGVFGGGDTSHNRVGFDPITFEHSTRLLAGPDLNLWSYAKHSQN